MSNKTHEHDYLIGLAYLGGVDLEKDIKTAVRLIMGAADRGLPEAIGKLAEMYQNGNGVTRDYEVSATWQEKLVDIYRERYADEPNEKNYDDFFFAMFGLADKFYSLAKLERAKICFDEILKTVKEQDKFTHSYTRYLAISYNNLGFLLRSLGNLSEVLNVYEEALKIQKALVAETVAIEDRRNLARSYHNLGNLLRQLEELSKAQNAFEKAVELRKELTTQTETIADKKNLADSYKKLGDVLRKLGKLDEAQSAFEKALELL